DTFQRSGRSCIGICRTVRGPVSGLSGLAVLLMGSTSALSQSAAPGATVDLPPVVVEGQAPRPAPKAKKRAAGAKSAPAAAQALTPADEAAASASDVGAEGDGSSAAEAARTLDAVAGGASVVSTQDMGPKATASLS